MAAVQYDTVNAIQDAPTFHPTMEEFKDFKKYIESIEPLVKQYGVAKIVPPEEWNQNFNYENVQLTIPHPIKQYVTGTVPGVYEVLLVESPGVAVEEFKEIALGEKVPKSAKYDYDSIERTFWKNIRFNPPMYGADMSGSLFSNDTKYWNLQHLDSILRLLDSHLPGITLPYLYFGMWKAMFAWHVEDMNLASINYLHFGAPKHWYSVPPEHGARFERIMQGYFPEPHKQCPEFLRHKMYMVSPQLLVQKHKIPIYRAVQEKGQFMITYPFAYHCGFNSGFNCAESVNFAMESWLEYGKKANSCKCDSDNVKINIDVLLERLQLFKEGKLDLEKEEQETMERYEATKAQNLVDSPSRRMMGSPKKKSPKKQKLADASALPTGSDEPAISLDGEMEDTSKRKNKVLTSEETNILEAAFVLSDGSIDKNGKETLADQLNWTPLGVYNWFRRKRRALTGSPPSTTKKETTAKGDSKTDTETRSPTRTKGKSSSHKN